MSLSKIAPCVCIAALVGCGNDSANGDDDGGFQADPPAVYVAKVKNILTGLAPTDDEVAAVVADPNALPGLIDGWMQLPQYQDKMKVFFELAFQQTQITQVDFVDIIPPRGLGQGKVVPLVVQNAQESFARTVLQLQAEGRPLTEAFTTKRVMMTTALMNLYAFMDERRVDDTGAIDDLFAKANAGLKITMESSGGPIDPRVSADPSKANFMHWYDPDIKTQNYQDPTCIGVDPISFNVNALDLEAMLYGEIPNHQGPSGPCPTRGGTINGPQIKGTDYTDWRMVTIRPPSGGETRTMFYDLYTLRNANELVIATPHPGFFSTPGFFANWPTNSSNQMRVTANQALIVATNAQIDGSDPTTPSSTPGLDAAHATPGSACYGCHQLLDPTRSILSATYSWFYYPQTDSQLKQQPGLFAFNGVIASMTTIDDFANLLATHPLVPTAWGQKLCYYANSAACDPTDPEFQRVTNDFKSSNFAWNTLVRELLSSPIVTNAKETVTAKTNGEIVSVSRRDHLCAQLNNRLGFVDICELDQTVKRGMPSTISQIVSGLPSDGYGRGSTVPVLPTDSNLFYRAGLENICSTVAQMVVDAAPNPQQPGARSWSSSDVDGAINDFVGTIMAPSASDARASQANAILHSHYTAATGSGASATDALRSTFVVACLSPSFIGIGM